MHEQQYWIGVDLHSQVIQVCVLDSAGDVVHRERHKSSALEAGREFVFGLAGRFPDAQAVVEALGSNRWFVQACRDAGLAVTVANSAALNLKASGRKTDQRDAYELARRLRIGDIQRSATAYHPTDEEYGLRQLERRRHELVKLRTSLIVQIRALLRAHRAEQPKGDLYSSKNLEQLPGVELPTEHETQVLRVMSQVLTSAQDAVRQLDELVDRAARTNADISALKRLPYVGPITSVTIWAELGDVTRFKNAKAVASYVGFVPRVNSSADNRHHGRIVNHGNRELRYVLGEWAVQLLSRHPTVKAWAEPWLRRMPKNKLRVALARKLIVGVWRTMRTGEVFDLDRCLAIR